MQEDFHYYCTAVLARAAGFNHSDALTLAYACQYTDNATESKPIRVGDMKFDPVRTAHLGIFAYTWAVQKRIYIPFHFIPSDTFSPDRYSFIVSPGAKLNRILLNNAMLEKDYSFKLCRLGLALHTFADSWAHQHFSGRGHRENDVSDIQIFENNIWRKPSLLDLMKMNTDILLIINKFRFYRVIGHTAAFILPDLPYLKWKYTQKSTGTEIIRNNTEIFLDAAKNIYNLLIDIEKVNSIPSIPFEEIQQDIIELFNNKSDIKIRCKLWKDRFQYLFDPLTFHYDKQTWRKVALNPANIYDVRWDYFPREYFTRLAFPMLDDFYESNWVKFHRAALKQRYLVLENIL